MYEKKRKEKRVHFQREFWFEISSFYGQELVFPDDVERKKKLLEELAIELTDEEKHDYIKEDRLLEHFFIEDEMIEYFQQNESVSIASTNNQWIASLSKTDADKWIYKIKLGENGHYMGDYLIPFELTNENIEIFHNGVALMSKEFLKYLKTGKYDESIRAFGKLSYD